jgi:hypothetical protein
MNEVFLFFSAITRLACIGFVVIAGLTIPEAWNLINETTYMKEGTTILVPIETCKPLSITLDYENSTFVGNTTYTFPNLDDAADTCHTLKYFINASVASMFFAGVAILFFILFDMMSRYCTGPISRSSVVGMSLFLAFMLIQTAACTFAIYNECQYWITFYEDRFAELEKTEVDEVRTYGNKFFFFLTSIVAVSCAGLLVIDSILGFCAGPAPKRSNKKSNEQDSYVAPPMNTTNTVAADSNDTMDNNVATTDYPEQPTNAPNPKSWTSY